MAHDWTTREGTLENIVERYDLAYTAYELSMTKMAGFNQIVPLVTDPNAKECLEMLRDSGLAEHDFMGHIMVRSSMESPPFGIPHFLTYQTISTAPPEFELTWQKIIRAWSGISDAGRMWTITGIDQMRQNIWNKPTQIKWTENPFE